MNSPADLYTAPLRLLTAPEQDVVLHDLLTDAPESVQWPDALRAAVGTRGFAAEVQAVLARARERGLDPAALRDLGHREGVPEFEAAGLFMEQYLAVLGFQSAFDYADLITRAVDLAHRRRDDVRRRFAHVFVDEYQDTDPAQVSLLRALAGDGRDLVVVGDPDQSIYGFRGADLRGILDFPAAFPTRDDHPAPVVALGTTRRFGPRLLRASRAIAASIGVTGSIPADAFRTFRDPSAVESGLGAGVVEALTFDTPRAEAEHISDLLRRAHLEDGVPWSQMAVLVRSGRSSIPGLRRSLGAAGVPVEVASDDTPLVREPAVLPLLAALRLVVDLDVTDQLHPDFIAVDRAEAYLTSSLGGLDAHDLRTLARDLRRRSPEQPSSELIRRCVVEPDLLEGVAGRSARLARGAARLLRRARAGLDAGHSPEEVLWTLWEGTGWSSHLRRQAELGGQSARLAHRDLDAVCALFEAAARSEEQSGHVGLRGFLDTLQAQQIPADTLAERGVRGEAVRLLTAHRAKGLEWRLVVVAHVQEGAWPDLRRRHSLLGADRIGPGHLVPPLSARALLAEERRLFYVAATRARQRLIVTAVASPDDDGEQPSRFLDELGLREPEHRQGRPSRPLSVAGLVAELRRTAADPAEPEVLRKAAATRLAAMATTQVQGRPFAPAASPTTWWGLPAPSRAQQPVRPADEPLVISASALQGLVTCPAQWFLLHEAGGTVVSSSSQGFGIIVHALADRLARGEVEPEQLTALVDEVWDRMRFRTPWSGEREREAIRACLERFVAWSNRDGARTRLSSEGRVTATVTLPDGQLVRLHGYVDRLELDADGDVVVVDLKTGKYPPAGSSLPDNPQLGLYQLAVDHGAADEAAGRPVRSAGAELIQLRSGDVLPKVQAQAPQAADPGGVTTIERQLMQAATALRTESFAARPGPQCDRCDFHAICPAKSSGSVLS